MPVFKENLTSKILQENSLAIIQKYKKKLKILELGCGDGNISSFIIKKSKTNHNYHLSDISNEAITEARKKINFKNVIFKKGEILKPWSNFKFDIIISDISSINDDVAIKSNWYKGIICNSGEDGLKNIKKLLNNINYNLNFNGTLILPIISLSNEKKFHKILNKKFKKIIFTEKILWPLPAFFKKNIKNFSKLKERGDINYFNKFGKFIAYTYVAICSKLID